MLGVLLESQARRSRRIGGSAVSVAAHGAVVVLAAMATTRGPVAAASIPRPDVVKVHLELPKRPVPATPPAAAAPALSPDETEFAIPKLPTITLPTIVPTALPDIQFDAAPTSDSQDFSRSGDTPRGILGGNVNGIGGGAGGEAVLTGSGAAMRLLFKPVPPRYPSMLQRTGVEGRVLIRFIVDTTGRIDMATVEIVESTHELFSAAVRSALPALRFAPAIVGDQKVRALAMMPFLFQLSKN